MGFLDFKPDVDKLRENLKDKDWHVRKATAEALGEIGNARAIKPLEELAQDNTDSNLDSYTRKVAEEALANLLRYLSGKGGDKSYVHD